MESRPVSFSQVSMVQVVLPAHTNSLGSIFGGVVMSWVDLAAAVCAQRHSQKPVVTAHVDDLQFLAPIYVGWVVNLLASVNYVGRTSMEVGVRVEAENPMAGENFHTSTAYLTFTALDSQGRPTPVPRLEASKPHEVRRWEEAQERRLYRLKLRDKRKKARSKTTFSHQTT